MKMGLDRLIVNFEYGEISNFYNKYFTINNDKRCLKKFNKKILILILPSPYLY